MKKLVCGILVFIITLTLSLSAFADVPKNNVAGTATLTYVTVSDVSSSYSVNPNTECPFGTFNYFNLYIRRNTSTGDSLTDVGIHIEVPVYLNVQSTIYVAVSPIDSDLTIALPFESYAYPEGDITVTFPAGSYNSYSQDLELKYSDEFTGFKTSTYSSSNSVEVTFRCFKDVPSNTSSSSSYLVSYTANNSSVDIDNRDWIFPIGFYVSIPSVVSDYKDGTITFQEAMDEIQSNLDEVINSPDATDSEKLVALEVAENDMELIKQESDIKYNGIIDSYNNSADVIIDNYLSGTTDIKQSLSDLQMVYFDALSQAVTAEQGVYINTAYSSHLAKLQLLWQQEYKQELDDVMTDEEMTEKAEKLSELESKYAEEQEILSYFDLADYESRLEFSNWLDTLPYDYTNYRAIFEYLIEEDKAYQISQFIIVPLSLVLVSVLLATTTVVLRGRKNG